MVYCESYRGWHIWHDPEDGYLVGRRKSSPWDTDGFFDTIEGARRDVDWQIADLSRQRETPHDSPSLDPPWWHNR